MIHRDDAIDKVLTGLRDAEAPSGMEFRILYTLEARAATRTQPGWRNSLPAWMWNATSTAYIAGSVALVSFLVVALFVRSNPPHRETSTRQQLPRLPIASTSPATPGAVGHETSARKTSVKLVNSSPQPESVCDEDALALSEMLAPSRPAPPLPLTQQETLMMRVLRHGEPEEQLAMLDPAVRARDAEQSEADFSSFFYPPLLNPNE